MNIDECRYGKEPAASQLAALRAENERLREALQTVKDESDDQWAVDVATAALGNAQEGQ